MSSPYHLLSPGHGVQESIAIYHTSISLSPSLIYITCSVLKNIHPEPPDVIHHVHTTSEGPKTLGSFSNLGSQDWIKYSCSEIFLLLWCTLISVLLQIHIFKSMNIIMNMNINFVCYSKSYIPDFLYIIDKLVRCNQFQNVNKHIIFLLILFFKMVSFIFSP